MKSDELLAETMAQITEWEQAEPRSRVEHEAAEAFTRAFAELNAGLRDGTLTPPSGWVPVPSSTMLVTVSDMELILPRVEHQQTLNGLERNAVRRLRNTVDDIKEH